jgi:hypothetical protein
LPWGSRRRHFLVVGSPRISEIPQHIEGPTFRQLTIQLSSQIPNGTCLSNWHRLSCHHPKGVTLQPEVSSTVRHPAGKARGIVRRASRAAAFGVPKWEREQEDKWARVRLKMMVASGKSRRSRNRHRHGAGIGDWAKLVGENNRHLQQRADRRSRHRRRLRGRRQLQRQVLI